MTESYRVLIVDDNPDQAEMVQEYLRISGPFEVVLAGGVHQLWECLNAQSFDIILLDYKLPDGNGLDALAELQSRPEQVPVVMVTGQGDERIAVQAMHKGATDYLIKSDDYILPLPQLIRKAVRAHRQEQIIQRSLEQIRYQALLLSNVRDAVVVWDMDGRISYWNPAAEALFGWRAEEMLNQPVERHYLAMFDPPLPALHSPAAGAGKVANQHVERRCRTRQRQTLWVSSRTTALYDAEAGNRPIGFMDVAHDISQRKQAEHALRTERNFVSAVLDTVDALIVVLDTTGRIIRFNRACEEKSGYAFNEVRGKTIWDTFLPPEEAPMVQRAFQQVADGHAPTQFESTWITRSQEKRLIAWSNRALHNQHGQVEYLIATGIDITDRKTAEAQVQAAQTHLAQAARLATIGELASGVAHQINNPLTTIIADAQLLVRTLPDEHPGRESAEAIQAAGWRLQEVVQRLVEFSRPAGHDQETVDVISTIQNAIHLVGAHIEASGITIDTQLAPQLPGLRGAPRQLEDLWVNLLLLARDAVNAGQGRTIRIRTWADGESGLLVEVCDDGQPIPAAELATIFEPNFIGSTSGRGTGLELSICREIVRQHGGEITAEIAPEGETIIRVKLPAERKFAPATTLASVSTAKNASDPVKSRSPGGTRGES